MPPKPEAISAFLVACNQAFRQLAFYPPGHPGLQTAADKLGETLPPLIEEASAESPFALGVTRESFTIDDKPFEPKNPILKKLAFELFSRRIKRLYLSPAATGEQLLSFFEVASKPRGEFGPGVMERHLDDRGLTGVRVNEAKFDLKVVESRAEPETEQAPQAASSNRAAVKDVEALKTELARRLKELGRAHELDAYRNLVEGTVHLCDSLRLEGETDGALQALQVLGVHRRESRRSKEQKQIALDAVHALLSESFLMVLLQRYAAADPVTAEEIEKLIVANGTHTRPMLLNLFAAAIEQNDHPAHAVRRPILQLIAAFGIIMVETMEQLLRQEKGIVWACGVLELIGEIDNLQPLKKPLVRGELGERRAVLRLLERLGDDRSIRLLIQAIELMTDPEAIADAIPVLARSPLPIARERLIGLIDRTPGSRIEFLRAKQALQAIAGLELTPAESDEIMARIARIDFAALPGGSGPDLRRIAYNLAGRLGGDRAFEWLASQVVDHHAEPLDNGWRAIARFG